MVTKNEVVATVVSGAEIDKVSEDVAEIDIVTFSVVMRSEVVGVSLTKKEIVLVSKMKEVADGEMEAVVTNEVVGTELFPVANVLDGCIVTAGISIDIDVVGTIVSDIEEVSVITEELMSVVEEGREENVEETLNISENIEKMLLDAVKVGVTVVLDTDGVVETLNDGEIVTSDELIVVGARTLVEGGRTNVSVALGESSSDVVSGSEVDTGREDVGLTTTGVVGVGMSSVAVENDCDSTKTEVV